MLPVRFIARIACVLAVLAISVSAQQALDRETYLARIAELQQEGPEIARTQGKQALINEYRTLIDENPGYANNIQLETQIGLIYESDLSETGEPPDMEAAYNQYLTTMETYDPSHPYMKQVHKMAANQALTVDPEAAESLYWDMIESYPDDPDIVTASYYNLAKLAEQNGDLAAAKEYYEQVLKSVPPDDTMSEAERLTVEQYEANAVLNLMADAIASAQTPEQRLAALEEFIQQYPDLPYSHEDLINELLRSIESMGERAESRSELRDAVRTLVRLLQERRAEEESLSVETRAQRRENRRRLAQGEDTSAAPTGKSGEEGDGEGVAQTGSRGDRASMAPEIADDELHDTADRNDVEATDSASGSQRWLVPLITGVVVLVIGAVWFKKSR
ncbi:MAG: hypothetical protein AMXMBFR82_51460 [Candidatus Hydrogenedentota bacterium]